MTPEHWRALAPTLCPACQYPCPKYVKWRYDRFYTGLPADLKDQNMKVVAQTVQAGEHRQTDGCYQVPYLPASRWIINVTSQPDVIEWTVPSGQVVSQRHKPSVCCLCNWSQNTVIMTRIRVAGSWLLTSWWVWHVRQLRHARTDRQLSNLILPRLSTAFGRQ